MELERLCELLGLDYEVRHVPMMDENGDYKPEYGLYVADLNYTTDMAVNEHTAKQLLLEKLESLIADIIRVNRNLTNEDLAEIMLKKAQTNLLTDLNNTHGDKKDA